MIKKKIFQRMIKEPGKTILKILPEFTIKKVKILKI